MGDVMLGRRTWQAMEREGVGYPWRKVTSLLQNADLRLLNLECAITASEERWLDDGKPKRFSFRAPPAVVGSLSLAGIDFASLANNHAGDFGERGLLDTVSHLAAARIAHAGAGPDARMAGRPAILHANGTRVAVVAFADYPAAWAAGPATAGINYLDLAGADAIDRAATAIRDAASHADAVVFSIHWGPNWAHRPAPEFREFARACVEAGASLFWGHSAHLVQGVEFWQGRPILFDTGDFIDDYVRHADDRNDLTALFEVVIDASETTVAVMPIRIRDCQATVARGRDRAKFARRFGRLCEEMGTVVTDDGAWLRLRGPSAQ
jgi:poly-gamma-glutamate synthesis protein (capsule biosynthesis protein)